MRKVFLSIAIATGIGLLSLAGCRKDMVSPADWEPVSFAIPAGWPQPAYTFSNNTLTAFGFSLGRKLFYDVRLSRDNTISCGSCHQQFASFANLDHPVSHGINNLLGTRNSPGLANMAWSTSFFWDGGVINLENQPINPIQNHVEMDMTLPEVVERLSADADYKARFKKVYGDETVNSQRIFKALAQFMGAMVSSNSRYDKHMRNEDGGTFTSAEQGGLETFRVKCGSCHKEPLFTDNSFRNNGLAPSTTLNDSGRMHITQQVEDRYKFKVPSLRNVELTRPYMHDGRFLTLEAAVEHYRSGIVVSPTLDALLASGITMTDMEKQNILSFLKTLTDTTFTKDTRFSEPAK